MPTSSGSGRLSGRVAVVTGADAGFGRALAAGLARAGARVALLGSSGREGAAARAIEAAGGTAAAISGELAGRDQVAERFAAAADALGPIDLLLHAHVEAAALVPHPLAETDESQWDAHCEALVRTALFCCQAAFAQMRDRGGRIVLVTPTAAAAGAAGLVPYTTAAEAQRILAKSAARQWGRHGITVNCVAPSLEQVADRSGDGASPLGLAEPPLEGRGDVALDVAPVVAFLASDDAHYVTGATLRVDGGAWMAG